MHHRLSLLSDLLLPLHLWYSHAVALTGAFSQESEPREVKANPDYHPPKDCCASIGGFFRRCVKDGIWCGYAVVGSLYPHFLQLSLSLRQFSMN